jgi:hypothetical protein
MTLQPPSQAEIAAAAAELGTDELEELTLESDAPAPAPREEAVLEDLELLDEPAAGSASDSGTLSLEEVATPQEQETFSHRQTERFRDFSGEEEQEGQDEVSGEQQGGEDTPSEPEPKQNDTDDWDFLDTRKK